MAHARFRSRAATSAQPPVQQRQADTEPLDRVVPPALTTPPALPPGYGPALTAAQRYSRSYTRLSRAMRTTYGPVPREIPSAYLRSLAPHTTSERETEDITPVISLETGPVQAESSSTPAAPSTTRTKHTLLVTCGVLLAIVVLGSWLGSLAVSSTLPKPLTASQKITRVNQLDPGQYDGTAQYDQWAYSTCSAAAMTAVINAYGHDYRLADILAVEIARQQITSTQGLLYGASSIARTVSTFGFSSYQMDTPSLDDVLQLANAGTPVIVGWPPTPGTWWSGGHILIVRGGDDQRVYLVDSSRYNTQSLSRSEFLQRWTAHFAVVVTPTSTATNYSVLGQPSVSADLLNQVLTAYHSPAAGKGQTLYDLGVKYDVDPVFALAFFFNESTFGTRGEATVTLALGNERCISGRPCIDQDRGGYAQFYSWEDGFEHWYMLITGPLYKGAGLTTVDTIILRYAPNNDHNNEARYIAAVKHAVDAWRAGKVVVA